MKPDRAMLIARFARPSRIYRLFRSFGVSRAAALWRQVRFLATGRSGSQRVSLASVGVTPR